MPAQHESPAVTARRLMRTLDSGVLSTWSVDVPGYPFGSVTPFVLTHEGRPVIYVSDIAQHTKNMDADPRACLTVVESGDGNQQSLGRVTVLGDAARVPEEQRESIARRYQRLFPESKAYEQTHGFAFYWLEPRRVRRIGGFGNIHWIERDDWLLESPAWAGGESGVVEHMNEDHLDALEVVARRVTGAPTDSPRMVSADPEGMHVRDGARVLYVPFANAAYGTDALRAEVIAAVRLARGEK